MFTKPVGTRYAYTDVQSAIAGYCSPQNSGDNGAATRFTDMMTLRKKGSCDVVASGWLW